MEIIMEFKKDDQVIALRDSYSKSFIKGEIYTVRQNYIKEEEFVRVVKDSKGVPNGFLRENFELYISEPFYK